MKLAEALNLRADLYKVSEQLKSRLLDNAKVQEGDKPAEDPETLLSEFDNVLPQLESLIIKINMTNTQTMVDGKTMTEILAQKDMLRKKIDTYRALYSKAIIRNERYSRQEVRFVSSIDGTSLQKKIDALSKQYRELDMRIQRANWETDLVE